MSEEEGIGDAEGRQERPEARRMPQNEVLGVAPDAMGLAVHEAAGRAMAAILLDKPEEVVTVDEAWAALASHGARPGDPSARSAAGILLGKAPEMVTQEETDS